jgi:tetratricopeptide (TPR) repeat protein
MRKTLVILSIILVVSFNLLHAGADRSFAEVKALARAEGKPVLIEFFRSDCEYCEKAKGAIEKEESIISVIKAVVYQPINVLIGEGVQISEEYHAGTTYPVFVLTSNSGEVIKRWVGFSTPKAFVSNLSTGLGNQVTVDQRMARLEKTPTLDDALFVANYLADTRQYMQAIKYYRKAGQIGKAKNLNYSYQIFENTANAIWNDLMPFDSLFPAADYVMTKGNADHIRKLAIISLNVARRFDHFDGIQKYAQAGIRVTANSQNRRFQMSHENIKADYKLHFEGDSAGAARLKIMTLGPDWNKKPNKVLQLTKWYAEREVYLDTAFRYCDWLLGVANEDKQKAQTYSVLAIIYDARDELNKAFNAAKTALELDPDHPGAVKLKLIIVELSPSILDLLTVPFHNGINSCINHTICER